MHKSYVYSLVFFVLALLAMAVLTLLPVQQSRSMPIEGPTAVEQPQQLPIRATFYYGWFPNAWTQQGIFPYTNYTPSLSYYDSGSEIVIQEHIEAMQYGKIDAGIISWWGQGHHTDGRIASILAATAGSGFAWTIYHEGESRGDPTVDDITADLTYLRDQYSQDESYLKINGRFVVFVNADASDGCAMVTRWTQANTSDINAYIVLKVFPGYQTCSNQPQNWHQYSPDNDADLQNGYSYTISPGFWKVGETPRLDRDLNRWGQNIRDMIASGAPLQLVTSFNEWGEGTSIETAIEWSSLSGYGAFLDLLHNDGGGNSKNYLPFIHDFAEKKESATLTVKSTPPTLPPSTTTSTSTPTAISMPTATSTPTATSNPASDPILVGAGDIAECDRQDDEATANLLDSIPGTIFTTGDNAYEYGTAEEFATCYDPSWGRHKDRTRPSPGNHDYRTNSGGPYYDYFGAAAGEPSKGYYSYDLGQWHIIVLNSNCSDIGGCEAGSPQELWLRQDLAANPTICTLAYWHHPLFNSGKHGNRTSMKGFWQALDDYGADVVLAGHAHHYERFSPQDPNGRADPVNGIREFIVGTGGKNHFAIEQILPNSEVANDDTFGVLKLTLHSTSTAFLKSTI